ncbi:MAG: hypothetical protein WCA08_10045, partial [Desulfoferrobacter sp.]
FEYEILTKQEIRAIQDEWDRMSRDPTSVFLSHTVGGLLARKVEQYQFALIYLNPGSTRSQDYLLIWQLKPPVKAAFKRM